MAWTRGEQRNPAEPEEGFYAVKLVKKGAAVAAKIIHQTILNTFEDVDIWVAMINDEYEMNPDPELNGMLQTIWLFGRKIEQPEFDFLRARYASYKLNWPDHPFANPHKPVDDLARRLMGPQED